MAIQTKCPSGTTPHHTTPHQLQRERQVLIKSVIKQDTWPIEKIELMNKYLKYFTRFTNSIDFDKL
jgi:hypothetical protein